MPENEEIKISDAFKAFAEVDETKALIKLRQQFAFIPVTDDLLAEIANICNPVIRDAVKSWVLSNTVMLNYQTLVPFERVAYKNTNFGRYIINDVNTEVTSNLVNRFRDLFRPKAEAAVRTNEIEKVLKSRKEGPEV